MYGTRTLTWVILAALASGPIAAQEPAPDALAAETEQINRERRQLILHNLALTQSEADGFWPIYDQFEKDRAALTEMRRALIDEFGEHYDDMTDSMAKKLLYDYINFEEEHVRLWKVYFGKFEKVLPIKKLARYYQIEHKIRAFVDAGIAQEIPLLK